MTHRTTHAAIVLLGFGAFAIGCAKIMGIEGGVLEPPQDASADGIPGRDSSPDGAGGIDSGVDSGADKETSAGDADAGLDSTGGSSGGEAGGDSDAPNDVATDADVTAPPCDANEPIDNAQGVFVSSALGDDSLGNGSQLSPFQTIAKGLQVAATAHKSIVYLDIGTYKESVAFTAAESGIVLRGGFKSQGASWTRDCDARKQTLIKAPGATAIEVNGTLSPSGLRELTVTTKATGNSPADLSGESIYAVRVSGNGAKFTLFAVDVIAGNGGAGGPASPGVTPASATGTCGTATPACSDGANGTPGAVAAPASAGVFSASGYTPGDGDPGGEGSPGHNGGLGAPTTVNGCTSCSGCTGVNCGCTCCNPGCLQGCLPNSCLQSTESKTSPPGPCGCGGAGATAGSRGRGGGASVALFMSGNVSVVMDYASLTAGVGGAGSPGGAGVDGASGSDGTTQFTNCPTGSCSCQTQCGGPSCWCSTTGPTQTVTSQPGSKGGTGGPSSKGGGGSGGPGFAVVLVDGATLVDTQSVMSPGAGGPGAEGAPVGSAGTKLVISGADAAVD